MLAILKSTIAAAILSSAIVPFGGAAHAADMLEGEAVTPVEFGTGWYIRGDVGATISGAKLLSDNSETLSGATTPTLTTTDENTVLSYGVGVGYKFTNNLRGDIGIDRFGSAESVVSGTVSPNQAPCEDGNRQTSDILGSITTTIVDVSNCVQSNTSSFELQRAMANAYYDMDVSLFGLRPYLGAGLGVVRNRYDSNVGAITCTPDDDVICNPTSGASAERGEAYTQAGTRQSGVAYHLMGAIHAGATYDISQNLKLDLGYSFAKLAQTPVFDGSDGIEAADVPTNFHTVKLGLRYEIW